MTDEDGNEISVDIYWPTDDQIAQLKSLIDSLDTPSYGDYTILSTILKDSINAIIGEILPWMMQLNRLSKISIFTYLNKKEV